MKVCNKKVGIGVAEKKREGHGVSRGYPGWGDGGLVVGEEWKVGLGTSTTLLKDGRLGVTVPRILSTVYCTL